VRQTNCSVSTMTSRLPPYPAERGTAAQVRQRLGQRPGTIRWLTRQRGSPGNDGKKSSPCRTFDMRSTAPRIRHGGRRKFLRHTARSAFPITSTSLLGTRQHGRFNCIHQQHRRNRCRQFIPKFGLTTLSPRTRRTLSSRSRDVITTRARRAIRSTSDPTVALPRLRRERCRDARYASAPAPTF